MEDKDLEKTKPIMVLKDLSAKNEEKSSTRESKYKDAVLKKEKKEKEEQAEEALAEKNIALAHELMERDKNNEELLKELDETIEEEKGYKKSKDDEDTFVTKIVNVWNSLSKMKKILFGVLGCLLLLLIIVLMILLIIKPSSKEEKPSIDVPEVEPTPVIIDNFYYKKGSLYFLDENDKEIGSYECKNKDDSLCYVGLNNNSDDFDVPKLIDVDGKEKEARLPIYENNYVFVYDNKSDKDTEIILYSITDSKEVGRYLSVKAFSNNNVIVKDTLKKFGLINIGATITQVLKNNYDYLGMIEGETNLIAKTKGSYVVISNKGKVLSDAFSDSLEIKSYNNNYVVTKTGKEYSVYDYKGNIIDSGYDYATTKNNYAIFVKDNKLYVRDKDKAKYTESGVKLTSKEYNKTFVYDKDGTLADTKRSFDVSIKSGNITIATYTDGNSNPKYTHLLIAEGLVNKKYNFINYFSGKLYFYQDKEKNKLIGQYTCDNANTVDSKSTKYSSCYVANDTVLEDNDMVTSLIRYSTIPIINNRYAFIQDGNNNVVLYDIVAQDSKATYSKVDSNTPNNTYKVTHYKGNLEVIAYTKKNRFGLIKVKEESIDVIYSFEYSKLEKLGDYYLGLDTSNNWRVLWDNSESIGFSRKVRGYNPTKKYFKTMDGDKYNVLKNDGTKVTEDTYAYVELYDTYYAALDSDRNLSIYSYDGSKLVNATVKVGNYALYGDANVAFKVTKDGDNYNVAVYDGKQYNVTVLSNKVEETPGS